MRSILIIFLVVILGAVKLNAQGDCNPFYILKEGKKWETSNYNYKDKYLGKQAHEIISISQEGKKLTAKTLIKAYDKKDKLEFEKEIDIYCEDGVVSLDMSQYLPAETMAAFKDMDVTMDINPVDIPQQLSVGETLEGGSVNMTMKGPITMTMNVSVKDRKVAAKEDITVPAGKYSTYKITYTIVVDMMGQRKMGSADWVAEGVGVVRTESYNKSGELRYYTVLTAYSE